MTNVTRATNYKVTANKFAFQMNVFMDKLAELADECSAAKKLVSDHYSDLKITHSYMYSRYDSANSEWIYAEESVEYEGYIVIDYDEYWSAYHNVDRNMWASICEWQTALLAESAAELKVLMNKFATDGDGNGYYYMHKLGYLEQFITPWTYEKVSEYIIELARMRIGAYSFDNYWLKRMEWQKTRELRTIKRFARAYSEMIEGTDAEIIPAK